VFPATGGSDLQERQGRATMKSMTPNPTRVVLHKTADFRDTYANSVQIRVNLWDFYLMFGTISQSTPENVDIQSFQGIYLSPQQAKALLGLMQQNVSQYEAAFGEIKLEPRAGSGFVQ